MKREVFVMRKFLSIVHLLFLFITLSAACERGATGSGVNGGPAEQTAESTEQTAELTESGADVLEPEETAAPDIMGEVIISFDYTRQSGHASNQFAVWIEDENGRLIKTLYATRFTVGGGYKLRPDSIPAWAERSGLASLSDAQADAISGATPQTGRLAYVWDLTGEDGGAVSAAVHYKFFVEGSLRWKNRVLYSGDIGLSGGDGVAEAQAEYFYEASEGQPALTDASPEHDMIGAVKAEITLAEAQP
jgi:hypothetical protein